MESKQLRIFLAVARLRSFTKASLNLHMVQPAVSMAVKKLEDELNLTLLDRQTKGVKLTAEGEALFLHAQKIEGQLQVAEKEMHALASLEEGEVRMGTPSMIGSFYLPKLLVAFKARYPGMRISIHAGGTRQLREMIMAGELDMGVILPDSGNQVLETIPFRSEEMVACVPPDHRFAKLKKVPYSEFAKETLVMFKPGYFQRDLVEEVCSKEGIELKVTAEANLIPVIKALVRARFGIASFLKIVIDEDKDLVGIPFAPPIHLDLSLAWRKDALLSKANRLFLDFMQQAQI